MSASTTTRPDEAAVRAAVEGVPDPELPPVSLGQLGMVERVEVHADGRVEVDLLPTFSGCPATEMMSRDVRSALAEVGGVGDVKIRWLRNPMWTTDRITAEGHEQLRSFGIAPPTGGGPVSEIAREGRTALPVAGFGGSQDSRDDVACPFCGSTAVRELSPFGPTPCRANWECDGCDQPFEVFKDL